MATSVDWAVTQVITIPRADMTLIASTPYELRELDLDAWRKELRDLEDDPDGRPWPKTHKHNTEKTLGGIVYARQFEIIAPYTVTFENGNYAVRIVGANHNMADVVNLNNVSFISNNSAGLINPDYLTLPDFMGLK